MARMVRKSDPQIMIDRLERRHSELKAQVAALDRRLFLTSVEQVRVNELKKEKLATKDALESLRK